MALTYGFYDSLNGDRKYNAKQWSSIFDGIVNDGVLASIGNCFLCTAPGNNMIVTVGSGRAWFDHTWVLSDGDPNNPITFSWASGTDFAPEPVQTRIDAIVIQTDSSAAVRANSITRVKGTPSESNPQKPAMTHTTYVNQYPIAYVTVAPSASVITQSAIENAVGTTATPFVTGLLEVLDSDELLAQWAADYAEWKTANNSDLATWRTNQQTAFTTWKTTEQAAFVAWFDTLEEYLTPSAEATLTAAIIKQQTTRFGTFLANGWIAPGNSLTFTKSTSISGTITINNDTFFTKCSTAGTYRFETDDTFGEEAVWTLNSVEVDLSEYGITLPETGWTGSSAWIQIVSIVMPNDGYYRQTIAITGMSVDDNPILVSGLDLTNTTVANAKIYNKNFGYLMDGEGTTANNAVTFKVYRTPTIDLYVGFKGA